MKMTEIEALWEEDCKLDITNLEAEIDRSPKLHSKYHRLLNQERLLLRGMIKDHQNLIIQSRMFWRNPDREGRAKGFAEGINPKIDVSKWPVSERLQFVDHDGPVAKSQANLSHQEDKVSFLESILWEIARRKDHIGLLIRNRQWLSGG